MNSGSDILSVDAKIHDMHNQDTATLEIIKIKREECCKVLDTDDPIIKAHLARTLEYYDNQLQDLGDGNDYSFYLVDALPLIEEYKQILKTPIKVTFLGSVKKEPARKLALIQEYTSVLSKYPKYRPLIAEFGVSNPTPDKCKECNSSQLCIGDNASYVCNDCGLERDGHATTLSYRDISRTNILQKDAYERRSHFRDCINQFQGKQNCKIDPEIYRKLEEEFDRHHLLVGNADTKKEIRYQKVLKEHIKLFLTELNYDKQYENVNFIFSKMTGKPCPDISHLEDQLMSDFDVLVSLYVKKFKHEKKIERKSFMNIQYVFYQLLNKNKYTCRKEDFNILKTIDRKAFHDDVFKELFQELGWNHTPFF